MGGIMQFNGHSSWGCAVIIAPCSLPRRPLIPLVPVIVCRDALASRGSGSQPFLLLVSHWN